MCFVVVVVNEQKEKGVNGRSPDPKKVLDVQRTMEKKGRGKERC